MENKKTKILTILCVLLSIGFISTAFAYYSASAVKVTNTFVASTSGKLFEDEDPTTDFGKSFFIDESKAIINTDGTYTLSLEDPRVKSNEYSILPGATVPKDPIITIKNKTDIKTYLYLEVVDGVAGCINYEIDPAVWKLLEGVTGAKQGKVYVYSTLDTTSSTYTTNILGKIENDPLKVNILTEQKVNVSANNADIKTGTLTFYAYLAQIGLGDEVETYTTCFIGDN